ncbi:MvdC/MvdD family ATP grasp protein [Streptomyces sp. NPDC020096]
MTVLVLTCPEDVTADMVVDHLNAMDAPVLRADPADFPERASLTASFASGALTGRITTGHRSTDLRDIRSIWVRRPGPPGNGARAQAAWVALESDHAWYGTLRALPDVRWMNHPDAHTACRYKMRQLVLAQSVGFTVPATVFTSVPVDAKGFADTRGPLVCKSVSGQAPDDPPLALPTTPVPDGTDFTAVGEAPTCLQTRVDKRSDIRLTVVGSEMFCARADQSSPGQAELDWRYADPETVRWRAVAVPPDIRRKTESFMKLAGLVYGAFDFAVTADETWHFLECNASGQFGFIELACGLPISRAIANWLAGPRSPA